MAGFPALLIEFISGVQTLALMNYTKWTWICYCSAGSYLQNCGLLHLSKDQFVPWEYQLSYFKVTVLSQGDRECSKYDSKFLATGSWEFTVKLLAASILHFLLHHGHIFLFTRPIDLYFHLYRYYLLMFSFSTLLLFVIYNIIIVFKMYSITVWVLFFSYKVTLRFSDSITAKKN